MISLIIFFLIVAVLPVDQSDLFFYNNNNNKGEFSMQNQNVKYGIEGHLAPELDIPLWVDGEGNKMDPVKLSDHKGKYKVLYCFQSWCPGCHSVGLPSLQKMVAALKDNDKVAFFAIQTVFEGSHANTYEKMLEIQKKYDLHIPFGHDVGNEETQNISNTMYHYRTGGTPWFILIDQKDTVVFNDYHLNTDKTIDFLKDVN